MSHTHIYSICILSHCTFASTPVRILCRIRNYNLLNGSDASDSKVATTIVFSSLNVL